jgi:hypothetical protein
MQWRPLGGGARADHVISRMRANKLMRMGGLSEEELENRER